MQREEMEKMKKRQHRQGGFVRVISCSVRCVLQRAVKSQIDFGLLSFQLCREIEGERDLGEEGRGLMEDSLHNLLGSGIYIR